MVRRVLCAFAIAVTGVLTAATAEAADRWILLGAQEIEPTADAGSIDVSKARGAFRAVRVEVKRQGLDVKGVRVVYGNGTEHREDRLIHLLEGERSKPIDQRNADRFIDRVELTFAPGRSQRKPRLEIWGLQSEAGKRAQRGGTPPADEIKTGAVAPAPKALPPARASAIDDGGDVMFGAQDLSTGVDSDVIQVGADAGKFARVRLHVLQSDLFVTSLKVSYADGSNEELAINRDMRAGKRSDWMDIKGTDFIKEIQLNYKTKPRATGRARVEIAGQYAAGWLGAEGEGRKYNEGWVLLGAQSAGMFGANTARAFGFDKDVIPVGANEGGFKRIRVKVKNRSITLKQLRIVYYEGEDTVIDKRTRVDPGQIEGPWDVKTNAPIKAIVASYRGRLVWGKGSGVPVVEIWGQH